MRLPGPCAFTGWRRVVLPLAMLSVGAAVATGLVSISASGGKGAPAVTTATTPNSDDPEIDNQAATLVLAPANDDNFTPPGACGGTTIAPSRCTAAVWVVDGSSNNLAYSSTPCSTSPSLQAIVLTGGNIPECTATPFISAPPAAAAGAAPAPAPAGQTAITGFPGARCIPGACRLFLVLAEADGDFNAPGLCGGTADIIGPCMVASFDTVGATGNTSIHQPSTPCPPTGDATVACTANPAFFPADMVLTLPAKGTPAPAKPPVHGIEVADEAATIVLWPTGDTSFDPPNTCGSFGLKATGRCTAAIMDVTASSMSASYASASCPIDIPAQVTPCTSPAFPASDGRVAITGYPGSVCFGPAPAPVPPATTAGTPPVVNCHIAIVLTPNDGDFNAPGKCSGTTIISAACTIAVVDTSAVGQSGGETAPLTTTSVCLAPPADPSDITASCTSPGFATQMLVFTLPESSGG
jgi:hypothetical protein